jgi:hypothetical protein
MTNRPSNTEVVAIVVLTTAVITLAFMGMINVIAWVFN